MTFKYFSQNGALLPVEQAVIPFSNIEYAYGFGVYETVRVSGGVIYFPQNHIARLLESAKIIGLEHPFGSIDAERWTKELASKAESAAFNIKMLLLGAARKEGAVLNIFCLNPLFPEKKLYKEGASFAIAHYEREYPQAKTLNMLSSYLAYRKAKESGCYDALLVNRRGYITEGTRVNFFAVKGNAIYSPPENEILPGITRRAVLRVALKTGVKIEEKNIPPETMGDYDGAFITSTSSKIVPVRKIGDFEFGPIPEITRSLTAAFDDFLSGCGGVLS
ncbi:MAG: aminotransferase class IV [Parcubacteria group bacterium]|nr:aminotransferase class IV [Parcubacteria group bacterium]